MAFEAKVKDEHPLRVVTAFGGREYVKGAWRPVQAGQEASADAHPFLELREAGGGTVSQEPAPVPGVVEGPAASSSKKSAAPAPAAVDEVDVASPGELDETQGTPPEATTRKSQAAEKGRARRGKV